MAKKINAQEWLEKNYKKEETKEISFILFKVNNDEEPDAELEGELLIDGYSNLKEIDLSGAKGITKLTIENCPDVEVVDLYGNLITAIPWLNKLTKLRKLNCGNTKITEIDVSGSTELEKILLNDSEQEIKVIGFINIIKKLVF